MKFLIAQLSSYLLIEKIHILQKCYQFFTSEKFKKLSHFSIHILPNYVTHKTDKEFRKDSHFKNMTARKLLKFDK